MSEQNWNATVVSAVLHHCSHEPFEWPEAPWEANPYNIVQTSDSTAPSWGTGGPRSDQGLWKLSFTPFQETGLQKLPEHLSSFCHSSSVQHSVSISVGTSCGAQCGNVHRFSGGGGGKMWLWLLTGEKLVCLPVIPRSPSTPRSCAVGRKTQWRVWGETVLVL